MDVPKTLSVVQWATGNIGMKSLQRLIEHPAMNLVGLFVASEEKVGKDAGDLCGLAPVGVAATNRLEDILALKADCVLYMRQGTDLAEVVALLENGSNIVTTRGDFHHPGSMDPVVRARVEAACAKGGTSIYSTGSSPGFITEAMLLPLISLQRRIDCVTIDEFADMASRDSPDMIFNVMGYGVDPGEFHQAKLDYVKHDFAGSLSQITEAMGTPFDSVDVIGEMACAKKDTRIAAGLIEKGKVAALRITVTGHHEGKPLLRFRANWYCSTDIDKDWNLRESGWRVLVEGDTPMEMNIRFPVSAADYPKVTPGFTAHRAVNAVHAVCAAPPGIQTTVSLPQVIARF